MRFWVMIKEGWRNYKYLVEHIPVNERTEHFKVYGRNGSVLVESNLPQLLVFSWKPFG